MLGGAAIVKQGPERRTDPYTQTRVRCWRGATSCSRGHGQAGLSDPRKAGRRGTRNRKARWALNFLGNKDGKLIRRGSEEFFFLARTCTLVHSDGTYRGGRRQRAGTCGKAGGLVIFKTTGMSRQGTGVRSPKSVADHNEKPMKRVATALDHGDARNRRHPADCIAQVESRVFEVNVCGPRELDGRTAPVCRKKIRLQVDRSSSSLLIFPASTRRDRKSRSSVKLPEEKVFFCRHRGRRAGRR